MEAFLYINDVNINRFQLFEGDWCYWLVSRLAMFRARSGFRQKLVYIILISILYSSWLLGLFPFTISMNGSRGDCIARSGLSFTDFYWTDRARKTWSSREIVCCYWEYSEWWPYIRCICEPSGGAGIWRVLLYFCSAAVESPTFDSYVIQKGFLVVVGLFIPVT